MTKRKDIVDLNIQSFLLQGVWDQQQTEQNTGRPFWSILAVAILGFGVKSNWGGAGFDFEKHPESFVERILNNACVYPQQV